MRYALEWYVARRYLAARRRGRFLSLITLIAVGGIAVGVMALITVIAVMSGLQRDLQAKILGSTPHVYVFEQGVVFRLGRWETLLPRLHEIPGVVSAEPFITSDVMVMPNIRFTKPGRLYGIDPWVAATPLTLVEEKIRAGELSLGPTRSGLPAVVMGIGLAQQLSTGPGDTLVIAAIENVRQGALGELAPKMRQFEITGVFETGMYEYDTHNLYAEIQPVQDLLDMPADTVSGIAINTTDAWRAEALAADISAALGYEYWAETWIDLNRSLFSALKLEKLAMAVILFLIVLVAAFNIVSTLIMVVSDKTREIGILKAMGMTDASVLRVFVLQGLTIGLLGTTLGALGGFGLVLAIDRFDLISLPPDVYFIDRLPVDLQPTDLLLIVVLSLLISFVATIYPSRQASRLLPVEAIRHE